jgi:hypothetical protein
VNFLLANLNIVISHNSNNFYSYLQVEVHLMEDYGADPFLYEVNIYGISQNPCTKDYIIVIKKGVYCKKCCKKYDTTGISNKWCKPCQINALKANFANCATGNEKIDNCIQEMQLKIESKYGTVFEWIPYNQFDKIKEIGKSNFATIYSAMWKNGPCYYKKEKKESTKVALKCLVNSQIMIDEFLNKV